MQSAKILHICYEEKYTWKQWQLANFLGKEQEEGKHTVKWLCHMGIIRTGTRVWSDSETLVVMSDEASQSPTHISIAHNDYDLHLQK